MKRPASKASGLAKVRKAAALEKGKNKENQSNLKKLKPLKKGTVKSLNASNLKQLGSLSLKGKVAKVAKEHSNEEEVALALQGSMSLVEKSNAYNQH